MTEFTLDDLLGGAAQRPEDAVGTVRCGLRLERLLGRGGMGAVYLARSPTNPVALPVVVKVLAPELAGDPQLRERFRREWAALRKVLPHPNVVRVLDVAEDDPPALVMEFVRGPSLERLIQEHGRVEPRRAATLARDVARGLAVVHGHGLIHRDIKPGNVLVDPTDGAKLVDFGLAKDLFRTAITKTGTVLGTAHYMAPEQFGADPQADPRSDLFSLGGTLYHLLTGRPPFVGEDVAETVDLITAGDYDPPEASVPSLPAGLRDVLSQLLMPELRYRYGSAQAVADDLDRVLHDQPVPIVALRLDRGGRFPLLPGRRFTIGADPTCPIPLAGEGVAPRHAQLRREPGGFVLRRLKGNEVRVDGTPLTAAHPLTPGDRIELGRVSLRFEDPRAEATTEPYLADARRVFAPPPVVDALIQTRDPRATLCLLERLAPDPQREARITATLRALLPAPHLDQALARWRADAAQQAARALALLPTVTGARPQADPSAWLGWWSQVRGHAPVQHGPLAAPPARIVTVGAEPSPRAADLGSATVVLIGRDRRCHLQLSDPSVARLHATVLRLHTRHVVRAEGAPLLLDGAPLTSAAFFAPGAVLSAGPVRCRLELGPAPPAALEGVVDPDAFDLLLTAGHPAVAAACVAFLQEAARTSPTWIARQAESLHPADPTAAEQLRAVLQGLFTAHVQRARAVLPVLLGADKSADAGAWGEFLAARRAALGPQVFPAGWLASTRALDPSAQASG